MTDPRTTVRLALYYRALATGSFLIGGAIAAVGLWLGLGDALAVLTQAFLQEDLQSRVLEAANLPLTVVPVAVGVTVWQVGKATAFYWTFTRALEAGTELVDSGTDGGPATVGTSTDGGRSGKSRNKGDS